MAGLISINKPHTDNIFSGEKGLEWRKIPLQADLYYVYETKNKGGCGMVIGEMRITGSKAVDTSGPLEVCLVNAGCVHPVTLKEYANNGTVYANFIKDAKRYDEPKPLRRFHKPCPYKLPDGTRMDVPCPCDKYTHEFDEETGLICCTRRMKKPPQSWCYVEELQDG